MVLKDVIRELIGEGKLVLFSSHQMGYVEEFCDSIAILGGGRIVRAGNLREIRRSYDRRKVLVSSPAAQKVADFCRERLGDIVTAAEAQQDEAQIRMHEASDKAALLAALAGGGFDIDAIRVVEPSLNDIFVEYTEGAV